MNDPAIITVLSAATEIAKLSPGSLAELRRMKGNVGSPIYWRLASRFPETIGSNARQKEWTSIIRILAILTEKGDPDNRQRLHDSKRHLGEVLCDGGNPDGWPQNDSIKPRPVYSEQRLMQLISARGPQRIILLERAARVIACKQTPGSGINVIEIAKTLFWPDDGRLLAEPYYRRLDRAERISQDLKKGEE